MRVGGVCGRPDVTASGSRDSSPCPSTRSVMPASAHQQTITKTILVLRQSSMTRMPWHLPWTGRRCKIQRYRRSATGTPDRSRNRQPVYRKTPDGAGSVTAQQPFAHHPRGGSAPSLLLLDRSGRRRYERQAGDCRKMTAGGGGESGIIATTVANGTVSLNGIFTTQPASAPGSASVDAATRTVATVARRWENAENLHAPATADFQLASVATT